MDAIFENGIIIAFFAPFFGGLINLFDTYFVDSIYDSEWDGLIMSALFRLLPCIGLLFFFGPEIISAITAGSGSQILFGINVGVILSFVGGAIFIVAILYYFKALFQHNDMALIQILLNVVVVVVPVLAFLIAGEKLTVIKYVGIAVAFLGASIPSLNDGIKKKSRDLLWKMAIAVFCFAISMSLLEKAYTDIALVVEGENQAFWVGFFYFCLGSCLLGLGISAKKKKLSRRTLGIIKKFFVIFLVAEVLEIGEILAVQKAISLTAVSYVSVIENFDSAFILLFSFLTLVLFRFLIKKDNKKIEAINKEQLKGWRLKVVAIVVMAIGVYMTTS